MASILFKPPGIKPSTSKYYITFAEHERLSLIDTIRKFIKLCFPNYSENYLENDNYNNRPDTFYCYLFITSDYKLHIKIGISGGNKPTCNIIKRHYDHIKKCIKEYSNNIIYYCPLLLFTIDNDSVDNDSVDCDIEDIETEIKRKCHMCY